MGEHNTNHATAEAFIARWTGKTASELSTAQSFVIELCALIGVAPPTHELDYMFERPITFSHGDGSTSAGRIDCYLRGHFVLEAKKVKAGPATKGFDDALLRARAHTQTDQAARAADLMTAMELARKQDMPLLELRAALDDFELRGEDARDVLAIVASRLPADSPVPEVMRAQALLA